MGGIGRKTLFHERLRLVTSLVGVVFSVVLVSYLAGIASHYRWLRRMGMAGTARI